MKLLKTGICLLLALLLGLSCAACGEAPAPAADPAPAASETSSEAEPPAAEESRTPETPVPETPAPEEPAPAQPESDLHHIRISIRDYGTVTLELDASAAPLTVQNFLDLAGSGFYDGLTFHRIMDGFMIQGGDPDGNGTGGSGKNVVGEFALNGWDNPISHEKGVISMARARDVDSASSQFFICVADAKFLDGQYAAFGHVTEGMEIVEQIAKDARPIDNNGTILPEDQPVIESITVLD